MDNRLPEFLVPTLESYKSLVEERMPDLLNPFYVVGSIALDEFNLHFSDADFVAVISHQATDGAREILRELHKEVENQHPRWKLSGMCLFQNDGGKLREEIGVRLVFYDGKLKLPNDFNAGPVT